MKRLDTESSKQETPYTRNGPSPKRLRGKCPGPSEGCRGKKCRFIKKSCMYSVIKANTKLAWDAYYQAVTEK